jgi:hypothetical protein
MKALGLDTERAYQVHDLVTDARFLWKGERNYVEIIPRTAPAHISSCAGESVPNATSIIFCKRAPWTRPNPERKK